MRNLKRQSGHMVMESLRWMLAFAIVCAFVVFLGSVHGCAHVVAPETTPRETATITAASVGAVGIAVGTALFAMCRVDDKPCQNAAKAFTAIGAAGGATATVITPPAPPLVIIPCLPPQSGQALLPGQAFCPGPNAPTVPAAPPSAPR